LSSKEVRFFRLPDAEKDTDRLRRWLDATGHNDMTFQEVSVYNKTCRYVMCERHFADDAFANLLKWQLVGGKRFLNTIVAAEKARWFTVAAASRTRRADSIAVSRLCLFLWFLVAISLAGCHGDQRVLRAVSYDVTAYRLRNLVAELSNAFVAALNSF